MAKSPNPGPSLSAGAAVVAETLMAERGRAHKDYSLSLHQHDFWQADMATRVGFVTEAGHERFDLEQGDCVVIPPGCDHRFEYPVGAAYLSFKFTVRGLAQGLGPRLAERVGPGRTLCRLLDEIVPESGEPRGVARGMIDHLIASLMIHHYSSPRQARSANEGSFVNTVMSYVRRQGGRHVTVREVAEYMHYSVSSVSSRFRAEEGVGIKQWLDAERGRVAEQYLAFSDMNASQIADHMGFPDLFSFSRFCRRVLGQSPRRIRALRGSD